METSQSSKREIDSDIWKFLEHEDPDYQSVGGIHERTKSQQPSKEFMKPAAFRSPIVSADSQHLRDIQLPTFAQKFSGNALDGSLKPARVPFRLPRTVIIEDDDPNALYALPKKLPRSSAKRDSLSSFKDQGFTGSLFKRYEAGSIISTVSSDHPPVVYHDREALAKELDGNSEDSFGDNAIFSNEEDLYSRPNIRVEEKRHGDDGERCCSCCQCRCCSRKVIVAVVVVVLVVVAAIAIAIGVVGLYRKKGDDSTNGTTVLAYTGATTSPEIANNQAPISLSGNDFNTTSVSPVPIVSSGTEISMVTATPSLPHNVGTNSTNSASTSEHNNSMIEASVSTPLSPSGSAVNSVASSPTSQSYVIANSTSPFQKINTSEFTTTPSDGFTSGSTTNPGRDTITSPLVSKGWTSVVSVSLVALTTSKVPVISSSPQSVTTSEAKSSPEPSTTSVKQPVPSSESIYAAKITSVSGNYSEGDSLTSRVVSSVTNVSASTTPSTSTTDSTSTDGSDTNSVV